jgi:hypothetical protein
MKAVSLLRTLGKLLVIWSALLPLITLPFTAFGPYGVIPLLDISLKYVNARIGSLTLAYEDVIVGALVLVGLGLSFMVLPERKGDG